MIFNWFKEISLCLKMLINAFMLQLAVGWWCDNPCMSSRVSRFICLFWVVNQQCEQRLADTPRRWVTRPRPLDFSEFLFLCQCPSGCKRQWSYRSNQFSTMELVWEFVSETLLARDLRTFSPSQFHPKIQVPWSSQPSSLCQKPRWYASERHWSWQALLSGST